MKESLLGKKIKKYVNEHNLNKSTLTCNELEEIASNCDCQVVDVMSWFRYGFVI